MNQEMTDYLESLDLSLPIMERVDSALLAFEFLSDEPLIEIFLTDKIDSDGQREFIDLWAFTPSFLMWSQDFLHDHNADVSPYLSSISYPGIQYEDLPFAGEASLSTRLSVEVQTAGRLYNELFATGKNAGELRRLIKKFLTPNVRKGPLEGNRPDP
jgi:hypothetical protein